MDGNCNIITEILLVISYTTTYCKKLYYYSNYVTVTSYWPTLDLNIWCLHLRCENEYFSDASKLW